MPAQKPIDPIPLRDAQRALTRTRIRQAGREAFFAQGYDRSTVEEIAQAAGLSRSTLYMHFRDKAEVLAAIVEDYAPALCAVAERLDGPVPTRPAIDTWLRELASFIDRERTPTVLIVGLADEEDVPSAIRGLGDRLIAALALRLPAFRRAVDEPDGVVAAWSSVVIREVGRACRLHACEGEKGAASLIVAGDLLQRFLQEQG